MSACPKRGPESVDALGPLLDAADRAWDQRARNGLEPVDDALQRAFAAVPESPEVAWRLARVKVSRGLMADAEEARVQAFGQAREIAWKCMFDDPSVRALQIEVGLKNALRALPPDRQRCALWATHAWTRWMADFGPDAASVDLERLDPLVRYLERRRDGKATSPARKVAMPGPPSTRSKKRKKKKRGKTRDVSRTDRATTVEWTVEEQVRITWTSGLLLAIRPEWSGRDRARAETLLSDVTRADPRNLLPIADLTRFGPEATRERWWTQLQGQRPETPEERAYVARVLSASPPAPSSTEDEGGEDVEP